MAQSTILASGTTAATSTDVVVASGATVTIGAFTASGLMPAGAYLRIMQDTPDADNEFAQLCSTKQAVSITSPGTYRVIRPVLSSAVGVFLES